MESPKQYENSSLADAFDWPPRPTTNLPGNIKKGALRIVLLNFPTYSLRASMVLLIVLATMVIYHVLMHVAKLILEVRKMALELSQPITRAKNVEPPAHGPGKDGQDHHSTNESTMHVAGSSQA
ncbi:hypothetical protein Btru_066965 [Bulinus truncatus]|nr:hypothetical protein Btru_066965 [Bulinus truncatus]